jgi:hypothetical protein
MWACCDPGLGMWACFDPGLGMWACCESVTLIWPCGHALTLVWERAQKHYRLQEFIDLRSAAREASHQAVEVAMTRVADAVDVCEAEALKVAPGPKAGKLTAKEQRAKRFDVRGKQQDQGCACGAANEL